MMISNKDIPKNSFIHQYTPQRLFIRELAKYNTDLSKFVPKSVENRLIKKMKKNNG